MSEGSNNLVTIAFVGTNYHGSQVQQNAETVQSVFQEALAASLGFLPDIKCCSRTDAGVHAKKFCISFFTPMSQNSDKLISALNAHLPRDVRALSARAVPPKFHARYSAKGKRYEYLVWSERVMDPFLEGRAYHFPFPPDTAALQDTASAFLGAHDFSAFCSKKSAVEDKRRTVSEASVTREGALLRFGFAADGFLYNMARVMAGTLLQSARGKLTQDDIRAYLCGRPRDSLLITAPACGLYLTEVFYDFDD